MEIKFVYKEWIKQEVWEVRIEEMGMNTLSHTHTHTILLE